MTLVSAWTSRSWIEGFSVL